MNPNGLDTSPIIAQYDTSYSGQDTIIDNGYCITDKYTYAPSNDVQTIAYYGTGDKGCHVFKNNGETYMDYWALRIAQSPRKCLNALSDAVSVTLITSQVNESFAYIVETGQILFAGKNTPYYGHRNISELN